MNRAGVVQSLKVCVRVSEEGMELGMSDASLPESSSRTEFFSQEQS